MGYQNRRTFSPLLITVLLMLSQVSFAQYHLIHGQQRGELSGISIRQPGQSLVDTISISGEINQMQPYVPPDASPRWVKLDPLKNNYRDKKIKKLYLQYFSGEVKLFFKGKDSLTITEDQAIRAGLLSALSTEVPEIITVDSPLYVGERILIHIEKQDPHNRLFSITTPIGATSTPDEYEVPYYLPGDLWILETGQDGKTKRVHKYHIVWPPGTYTEEQPDFFIGKIHSVIADHNLIKAQNELTIPAGYRFREATMYFSGSGFRKNIVCTDTHVSMEAMKKFIDLSLPGTDITIDNVLVIDPKGQKLSLPAKSYKLIDNLDIRSNYAGLISHPDYPGGTIALLTYILQNLADVPAGKFPRGKFYQDFSFIINPDGSVEDLYNRDHYAKDVVGGFCYDVIKNSTGWTPGSYKGKNVRMILNMYFTVEIK